MTDKETEIKALAGTLYDLKEAYANMGMMNANMSFEERKKGYEEYAWIRYQITVAENKLKAATIIA